MSKRSYLVVLIVFIALTSAVCFWGGYIQKNNTDTEEMVLPQDIDTIGEDYHFTTNGETTILLSGSSASVSGSGVSVIETTGGTTIEITSEGTYHITGSITNGQIVVNAPKEKVKIILDNASITSNSTSAIYVYKSQYTIIELVSGTTNTVTDASSYDYTMSYSSETENEPNAAIFSKSDLIIDGNGTLIVNASHSNGIISKDHLKIEDASINISAANNGINGKDSTIIKNAIITVNAKGDGIRSTNDQDETLGFIQITDSVITIQAGEDGIQAETNVTISGGTYEIVTGNGYQGNNTSDISMKGIKAGKIVTIDGATMDINTTDDAIHSNGNVNIMSGSYIIKTADDGIHADEELIIASGDITISNSHEALEGNNIIIYDGNLDVNGTDDGINVNGGVNNDGMFGGFGGREMANQSTNTSSDTVTHKLVIKGGNIIVHSNGDGLDSNGSIEMSGGTVIVYGPTNSGNGAIDYDGTFDITGGTLIAIGSSGMAMGPSNTSSQTSFMYQVSNGKAGSEIVLKNASGKEIVKVTSEKQFSNVVISTPELSTEETYSLMIDGVEANITNGSQEFGGRMNGQQMGEPPFQDDFSMREIPDFDNEFESGNMQNFEGRKMRGEKRWNNQF